MYGLDGWLRLYLLSNVEKPLQLNIADDLIHCCYGGVCVRACVCACVRACVRACVCVCVCVCQCLNPSAIYVADINFCEIKILTLDHVSLPICGIKLLT